MSLQKGRRRSCAFPACAVGISECDVKRTLLMSIYVESVRRVGPVPIHTKLFYTLGDDPKSLLRKNYYWEHLTLDSYYVYERIFHDCKPTEGRVPTASCEFLGPQSRWHLSDDV